MMQSDDDDDDDGDDFSFNVIKNHRFGYNISSSESLSNFDNLSMSGHSANKHYSTSKKIISNSVLDIDSDDEINNETNPRQSLTNTALDSTETASQELHMKTPSVGSSGLQNITGINSPRPERERTVSLSDSDESDELGITKKKKNAIPGEYDPENYAYLEVNNEIKEIFQYIIRYTPQQLNSDYKFKPFIPEFIPAVGDIDAFLKIIPPENTLSGEKFNLNNSQLGLTVLDEPASNQSDPALLYLQLKAASISTSHSHQSMLVKKVENVEKDSKVIDKWIKDVAELHRNRTAQIVKYVNPMPDLDDLMQQWPEQFENYIKLHGIPSPKFCGTISQYVDAMCSLFDIPIYKNKIQSLHAMFCLYAAIRNSELYRGVSTHEDKDENLDITENTQTDHLVLE